MKCFTLLKKLYTFELSNTQLCSICKMEKETKTHLFYYCTRYIQDIWNQVQAYLTDCLHFLKLRPRLFKFFTVNTADCHFGFHNNDIDTFLI